MSQSSRAPDRESAFRSLYEAFYPDVLRFVRRRASPDRAEDVVADCFLVAWRRFDEVPRVHDDARAWVFGIARNTLLNDRRGEQRRLALGVRLAEQGQSGSHRDEPEQVVARIDLARAWRGLSERHQEALALAVLDGLSAPHAATVLGVSPVAFRLRLTRARRALRLRLDHLPQEAPTPAGFPERITTP